MAAFVWLNQQYIIDSVIFWRFQPTSEIATIATRSQLTDTGKFMFYASQPTLEGRATFSDKCGSSKEESTAILGCYAANRIYLFDITDKRLDGIKEVTAAHEMLHAVYQRMSATDKQRLEELLENEYKKLQSEPEYAERMAFYARNEPGQRANELHSIIGTEVRSVSPELEAHYARYFTDRSAVVDLYDNYRQEFRSLQQQTTALGAQLDELSKQIELLTNRYRSDVAQLESDIQSFNERANSGGFSSQSQFASERASLVRKVNESDSQRSAINTRVETYNDLRTQYNEIATQTEELYESLDSSLTPTPKV